jgi:FAD/FMN-containing dehydrogenase
MEALFHLLAAVVSDRDERMPIPAGFTDDASHLNQTRIAEIVALSKSGDSVEDQLRRLLHHVAARKLSLSIAGMRHTMGGQTFTAGGVILDMLGLRQMHLNERSNILHVQAGACWSDVLRYLHERQRSLQVMQSNNSFSVGGSLGANCHGWQPASPPIASTVVALRILLADGSIRRCSREEDLELFSLVLGGYGLFGIVLDAELAVCSNICYCATSSVLPSTAYADFYQQHVLSDPQIGLAYGRFSVEPGHFLREVLLTTYHTTAGDTLLPLRRPGFAKTRRAVFRSSVGSTSGKALRWELEKRFGSLAVGQTVTRNTLLNEGIEVFENREAATTDILQEYFVPVGQLEPFLERLRVIIPARQADLLNMTIRFLRADHESFLRYADQDLFALVMLFHQQRTQQADQRMAAMTRDVIDAVLQLGGRYYLPYRLHATRRQFAQCYPQAQRFFELKRQYDPQELFQNELYRTYGKS